MRNFLMLAAAGGLAMANRCVRIKHREPKMKYFIFYLIYFVFFFFVLVLFLIYYMQNRRYETFVNFEDLSGN